MPTENKYKDKIITIPNLLSFFRIALIPVFVWLYIFKEDYLWALIVLAISWFSDLLDGYIAKRFNMISDFGKGIDPIADKLTQAAVLFCLIFRFELMLIPFGLLILKELVLGVMSFLVIKKTSDVPSALWYGKVTTALLYAMMVIHVIWYNLPNIVSYLLIFTTVGFMGISLILYSVQHIRILLKKEEEPNNN